MGCLALLATGPARAAPAPLTLEKVLAGFRGLSGLEAHFREEKHMSLLAAPLVSEGDIYFAAPDHLLRRVSKPAPSSMVINGATLSFQDAHGVETMSLDRNPVARLFVDGFVKILLGDAPALDKLYDMTFKPGSNDAWEVRLKPKVAPMSQVVEAIEVSGRGLVIDRLRVAEIGGDETITRFTAVNTARQFSAAERQRLFAIATP
jgi:outer membrane lipoprotein-sorting protein